ncbi:MAG: HIRAN domain-containing protein [Pseudomonadota bacterium]
MWRGSVSLLVACLASGGTHAAGEAALILQTSPLAGFQHHAGAALFPLMRVGDPLQLGREPDNPYDPRAVRVSWRGAQIGYVPRLDNVDLARFMDRGVRVEGRIVHLQASRDPWKRVLMEILIRDEPPGD